MVTPFETVVKMMVSLGFYDFLFPFVISAAIFYALLKRSKMLGDSVVVNAVVSLSMAFMILGFPVLAGFALGTELSVFFTQAIVFILVFVVGMIIASLFYPDLPKMLAEQFTRRTTMFEMLAVGIALFITSGLVIVFTQGLSSRPGEELARPVASPDIVLIVSTIVIFVVLIMIAASSMRGES